MSQTREPTNPTAISISLSDEQDHLIIRDLNGKQYICPIESPEKLGKKIIDLAKNSALPFFDVAKISVTDDGVKSEPNTNDFDGVKFTDFSKDNLQNTLINEAFKFVRNATASPATGKRFR